MKDFKFFQKGTVDMVDGDVRATSSFNDDTPEGHMNRRALYHTDRNQYDRLRHPNNEMERFHLDRHIREEVIGRINGGMSQEEILRRRHESFERNGYYGDNRNFFPPISVTKVKETFWTKFKDVMKESWRVEPVGVVVVSVLTTIVTIIGIAKLLGL
jgi:hypothetical protein